MGLYLPMQGMGSIPSGDLRSHTPRGQKKNENIKLKQYCNKCNKTLKMVHIKKKSLKKIRRIKHLSELFM